MRTVLEEFQFARRPELASQLLRIIIPLAYHAVKSGEGHEAVSAIYTQWYENKNPIDEPFIHGYCDWGFTVCIKCETALNGDGTALLRHCRHCKSHTLWNPVWFLDWIAEKAGVHPSYLETILSEYIYVRTNRTN